MNSRIEQVNWALLGTTVLGLLLAAFLGITIASSDYLPLLYIAAFFAVVAYITYFQRFTWQIALFLCYLGLSYKPTGFEFSYLELTCALGACLAAVTVWQKRSVARIGVLQHRIFRILRLFLFIWIVYAAIHMFYNFTNPLRPAEFATRNALKSYFAACAPAVMLWYFCQRPAGIRITGSLLRTLVILTIIGLAFNVAVVCYGIFKGSINIDPNTPIWYPGRLFIPGINAKDNPWLLRWLGPNAVLLATVTLSYGKQVTGVSRMLSVLLMTLGIFGTFLSGGRAAIAIAVSFALIVLLFRKQIVAIGLILALAGLFVIIANLFSGWINREAPLSISRPLQLVMLSKNQEASRSIQSSTRWRRELFFMSLHEWRSDPRIFWFGRATYGFGAADFVAHNISGGFEAGKESSLRRGATHNLISDLLIAYGLIGCIFYYTVIFGLIRFLWIVYRSRELPPQARPLSLVCLITSVGYVVYASVGGGFLPIELVWLLIILIAVLYRQQPEKLAEERAPSLSALERHAA